MSYFHRFSFFSAQKFTILTNVEKACLIIMHTKQQNNSALFPHTVIRIYRMECFNRQKFLQMVIRADEYGYNWE